MERLTPHEVCERLGIQSSTLRKYSLLFEKEHITFARNKNNSRSYTVMQVEAIESALQRAHDDGITLEEAVTEAANSLKKENVITQGKPITPMTSQRHNGDITAVTLQKVVELEQQLAASEKRQIEERQQQKERDALFVEILERMQSKIDSMEKLQKELAEPDQAEEVEEAEAAEAAQPTEEEPVKKKGFFARFFK